MDHFIGLGVEQKLELVQKELEDTKDEIRHMRANAERDLQHHEVSLSVRVSSPTSASLGSTPGMFMLLLVLWKKYR
jgi:hypothetical protein